MMNLSDSSGDDCKQSFSNTIEGRVVTQQPPLPVASCSAAVHPSHYWGYSGAADYVVETPDSGMKMNAAEEEVSITNIFADTYAKAIGLYIYPKAEEGEESTSASSCEDSADSENDVDEGGSWPWVQEPNKTEVLRGPCYIAEESEFSPDSPTDDRFDGQLQDGVMANCTGQPMTDHVRTITTPSFQQQNLQSEEFVETRQRHLAEGFVESEQNLPVQLLESQPTISEDLLHSELRQFEEENVDSMSSWNDSESYEYDANDGCAPRDAMLPACSEIGCPGNITPYFQKFILPKHKMVPRGPNRPHNHHSPSYSVDGAMTTEQRKLVLRRLKNREAAKRCRKKKKEEFRSLLNEQDTLLSDVHQLYHEINLLKEKLSFHSTPTGYSYISF